MLITSYKIDEVHFCLLGTNGFHARAKNESKSLTAADNFPWKTSSLAKTLDMSSTVLAFFEFPNFPWMNLTSLLLLLLIMSMIICYYHH